MRWHAGFLVRILEPIKKLTFKIKNLIVYLRSQKDCPKGELDKKQFINVFKEFYPQGKAEKFASQIFNVFDSDKSGKIDFIEYLIAISTTSSGNIRKKLQMGFKLYDTNGNGSIDRKEMHKLIEAIYDLTGEENRKGDNDPKQRVEAIFSKLDINQNGNIGKSFFFKSDYK